MKKDINFRLFKVVNKSIKDKVNPLYSMLSKSLEDGKKLIENRIRNLKDTDPTDKDLLAYYAKTEDFIYGVMMRIAYAKDVPELPADFAKAESIDINKILKEAEAKSADKMVCKSMYHFFVYKDFVVTDLPNSRPIACFQDYINWLLLLEDDLCFSINPAIETGKIQLSRLKSVVFKDAFEPMPTEKKSTIRKVVDKILDGLIEGDDLTMKELHAKKIVSASMTVDFGKPKKMTVEDYEKTMSAILKTIEKPENVVFVMNSKKQIQGTELLYSRMETLENDPSLIDKDYIHAMKNVISSYVAETKK